MLKKVGDSGIQIKKRTGREPKKGKGIGGVRGQSAAKKKTRETGREANKRQKKKRRKGTKNNGQRDRGHREERSGKNTIQRRSKKEKEKKKKVKKKKNHMCNVGKNDWERRNAE